MRIPTRMRNKTVRMCDLPVSWIMAHGRRDDLLHITNGDVFNQYLITNCAVPAVPFRETMMDGETVAQILSDAFVRCRAAAVAVSEEEYRGNMAAFDGLQKKYGEICLWFGRDTYCQVNLLTLLAHLEQIGFGGRVTLNYIDDETMAMVESNIEVALGVYAEAYKTLLIDKQMPSECGVLDMHALYLYLDYHSENGALARLVREDASGDTMKLLYALLAHSQDYGLSDIQAKKLIDKYMRKS